MNVASGRIIDLFNGIKDLNDKKIRMISSKNLKADPIRLLRAYRLGALLNFSIDQKTSSAIKAESFRIYESAGERIRDELTKLFNSSCSYQYLVMMNKTGLLASIFPELEPLKKCSQNRYHCYDVFDHTLKAYEHLEKILQNPEAMTAQIKSLKILLPCTDHIALLKHAILLHDIGKPSAISVYKKNHVHFYDH
jgi:poly(A) polymerase